MHLFKIDFTSYWPVLEVKYQTGRYHWLLCRSSSRSKCHMIMITWAEINLPTLFSLHIQSVNKTYWTPCMCDCVFLKVLKLLYHSLYLSQKYRGKTDVCSIVFCSFFFLPPLHLCKQSYTFIGAAAALFFGCSSRSHTCLRHPISLGKEQKETLWSLDVIPRDFLTLLHLNLLSPVPRRNRLWGDSETRNETISMIFCGLSKFA